MCGGWWQWREVQWDGVGVGVVFVCVVVVGEGGEGEGVQTDEVVHLSVGSDRLTR